MSKPALFPLLKSVVSDNPTYKFPIEAINKELTSMFLEPLEFDYFMIQAYRKLKKDFEPAISHIFLQHLEIKLLGKDKNLYHLTLPEYQARMEDYLNSLDNLYISKIDKKSSDGEMLSAMISQ